MTGQPTKAVTYSTKTFYLSALLMLSTSLVRGGDNNRAQAITDLSTRILAVASELAAYHKNRIPNFDFAGWSAKQKEQVEEIRKLVTADLRLPTADDISGAWTSPCCGPYYLFVLNEDNGKIQGVGIFSGCMSSDPQVIRGKRDGDELHLTFMDMSGLGDQPYDIEGEYQLGEVSDQVLQSIEGENTIGGLEHADKTPYKVKLKFIPRILEEKSRQQG